MLALPRGPDKRSGDPTDEVVSGDRLLAIFGAAHWGSHPGELADALRRWAGTRGGGAADREPGALADGHERLTFTVEEAAATLGISRAFAHETISCKEISHIRIGRRVLLPRSARDRPLGSAGE